MSITPGTLRSGTVVGGAGVNLSSVVVDAGHNALLVRVCLPTAGFPTDITAMSWNGTSLARVTSQANTNGTSADMWFAVNVTPGTANLIFSANHGFTFEVTATSLGGVDTSTPLGTAVAAQTGAASASNTVTTTVGDLVASIVAADPNTVTFAAANSQTVTLANQVNGATVTSIGHQTATGTSTADGYTVTGAGRNTAIISVPIHAAAGGGSAPPSDDYWQAPPVALPDPSLLVFA